MTKTPATNGIEAQAKECTWIQPKLPTGDSFIVCAQLLSAEEQLQKIRAAVNAQTGVFKVRDIVTACLPYDVNEKRASNYVCRLARQGELVKTGHFTYAKAIRPRTKKAHTQEKPPAQDARQVIENKIAELTQQIEQLRAVAALF